MMLKIPPSAAFSAFGELDHAGHIRIAAVILHHTENAEEDQGDGVGDAGGQDHGLDVGDNVRTGHGGSEVRRIGQRAHLIAEVGAGEDGTGSHAGAHAKAEANAHQATPIVPIVPRTYRWQER